MGTITALHSGKEMSATDIEDFMEEMQEVDWSEVLMVGFAKDGGFVVGSSWMSSRDRLWLLELCKDYVLKTED